MSDAFFEEIDNLTRAPTYAVGVYDDRADKSGRRSKNAVMVLATYTPTANGYAQRCRHPEAAGLNNDYISGETMRDLDQWLVVDFGTRFKLFDSKAKAEAYLSQHAPHV